MSDELDANALWSTFPLDPRTPAHADLRASDADRDRLADVLAAAFADGRLDREEFDDRSAALTSARTLGALPGLVHDLIAPTPVPTTTDSGVVDLTTASPADLARRAEEEWDAQRRGAILAFLGPTIVCWAVWIAVGIGNGSFSMFPWPLIVTAATGFHAARTLAHRDQIVRTELRRLHEQQARVWGR